MDHFPKIETKQICNRQQQNKGYKRDKNCAATPNEVFAEEMKVVVVVDSKPLKFVVEKTNSSSY